jgi:flagellar motor switch/type III secretory pathway protein FliN
MKSILDEKGTLTVELGESWLTRDEAESLTPGDTVKLNCFAGDQVTVRFNGFFLGTGEVVIIDKNWAVRLEGTVETARKQIPMPGRDLTGVLPVSVRMGSLSISLTELKGLKIGTVINLDRVISRENGELLVAGIPAAIGEVASLYDNFALRITKTVNTPHKRKKMTSGNLLEAGYETDFFRIYDFCRPDMFNRLAIKKIKDIHINLLNSMKNRFPQMREWSLISLDEQAFSDSFDSYKDRGTLIMTARDRHYVGQDSIGDNIIISHDLIQSDNPSMPLSATEFDQETEKGMERINREWGLIHIIDVKGGGDLSEESLISHITASWRHLTDFDFTKERGYIPFEEKKEDLKGNLRFGVKIHLGPDPSRPDGLHILYPFMSLSPVNKLLSF